MTSSLSTSSSEQRIRRSIVGLVIGLLVFALCNAIVALLHGGGVISSGLPVDIISDYRQESMSKAEIWFFGNSVLAASVDVEQIEKVSDRKIKEFPLGSATLRAQVLLATDLLERNLTTPPKQVVFVVTKDDLNLNGSRQIVSSDYIKVFDGASIEDQFLSLIPLYACRASIKKRATEGLIENAKTLASREKKKQAPGPGRERDISEDFRTTYLASLGNEFEVDLKAVARLKGLAEEYPNVTFHVVFPPVSESVFRWQSTFAPKVTWDSIVASFSGGSIAIHDHSNDFPSTSRYFKDAYHMKRVGQSEFNATVCSILSESAEGDDFRVRDK